MNLPQPSEEEVALSQKLQMVLQRKVSEKSPFWFADFMEVALYYPGLGYYQNARTKFGKSGDFITAPTLTPLFGQTLAKGIAPLLQSLEQQNVLEFGGGTGDLAADILSTLGDTLSQYYIVELSASLAALQKATIEKRCPEYLHKVQWLQTLAPHFIGVIIANEVLDAMPLHRFKIGYNHQILLQALHFVDHQWQFHWLPAPLEVAEAILEMEADLQEPLPENYVSEYNHWVDPWIKSISASLSAGFVLLIDYGLPRGELYNPHRTEGSLRCYHKQYVQTNPLWYPGIQDITAHVDFTQIAIAAMKANLQVSGYCSQGAFLMSLGITEEKDPSLLERQAIQQLISPSEMGEFFKVMLLSQAPLPPQFSGFKLQNDLVRL